MNFLGLVSFSALLVLIHRLGLMACKSAPWTKQVWLALISFSFPVLEHPLPLGQPSSRSVCWGTFLPLRHHKELSLLSVLPLLHIKTTQQTPKKPPPIPSARAQKQHSLYGGCRGCAIPRGSRTRDKQC